MAAIYYSPALRHQERLILYLVAVITTVIPGMYGLDRAYDGYILYGPAVVLPRCLPWLGLAGLLFLVWLGLFLLLGYRSKFGVLLYQNGLRMGNIIDYERKRSLMRLPLIPWEDIEGIAMELIALPHEKEPLHRATLHFKGGQKIHLVEARSRLDCLISLFGAPRIENLPELITRLKARLYPQRYTRLRANFLAGQPISFGRVGIQTQGMIWLNRNRKLIPWKEVQRVTIRSGKLVVELNSPNKKSVACFPISDIPNLELLLKLIEAYLC